MKVAFAGRLPAAMAERICAQMTTRCEPVVDNEAAIIPKLGDCEMLVSMAFTREMAAAAPNLRLVQVPGAGLDRIDRAAFRPGQRLANVFGHEVAIAEYVIGAMIALTCSFCQIDRKLRQGEWASRWAVGRPAPPLRSELKGKTIAILGLGHIGLEVARRAHAFGMRTLAVRRDAGAATPPEVAEAFGYDRLDEVLREADFVVVTLPLVEETTGLINAARLGCMKPTAFLVNVGRAEVVEETALYRALAGRRIAGAALDVWYRYPTAPGPTAPSNEPFYELDNILMTPHMSAATDGMIEARIAAIAGNIDRLARGEDPENEIDLTA